MVLKRLASLEALQPEVSGGWPMFPTIALVMSVGLKPRAIAAHQKKVNPETAIASRSVAIADRTKKALDQAPSAIAHLEALKIWVAVAIDPTVLQATTVAECPGAAHPVARKRQLKSQRS